MGHGKRRATSLQTSGLKKNKTIKTGNTHILYMTPGCTSPVPVSLLAPLLTSRHAFCPALGWGLGTSDILKDIRNLGGKFNHCFTDLDFHNSHPCPAFPGPTS